MSKEKIIKEFRERFGKCGRCEETGLIGDTRCSQCQLADYYLATENFWLSKLDQARQEEREKIQWKIRNNISCFTGQGSEYNRGRADGYDERNKEILDLLNNYE